MNDDDMTIACAAIVVIALEVDGGLEAGWRWRPPSVTTGMASTLLAVGGRRLEAIDALRRTHGGFDVEALDLLPALGQQGRNKVDGQRNVVADILW